MRHEKLLSCYCNYGVRVVLYECRIHCYGKKSADVELRRLAISDRIPVLADF